MMQLHPLCEAVPAMSADEYQGLVADLRKHGQRYAIVTFEGKILDGRHRYSALRELELKDVDIRFLEWSPRNEGDSAAAFVESMAVHRRHMNAGQRAACVASLRGAGEARTVGRPKSSNIAELPKTSTVEERAQAAGVSERTQAKADAVQRADPELAKQVARGEKKLEDAVAEVKGEVATPKPKATSGPAKKVAARTDESIIFERDTLRAEVQRLNHEIEHINDRGLELAELVTALQAVKDDKHVAVIQQLQVQLRGAEAERDTANATREVMKGEIKRRDSIIRRYEEAFGELPKKGAAK